MGTTETQDSTSASAQTHLGDTVEYVVTVRETLVREGEGGTIGVSAWVDVATVKVPPRTKRRTIIEKGLADAGIEKTPELEARLLDGGPETDDATAASYVWRPKPPEPQALRLA